MQTRTSDHVTLLVALVAVSCLTRCLASACTYGTRPHPGGFCGERLSTLHNNVCTVVRVMYPEWFSDDSNSSSSRRTERSVSGRRARRGHRMPLKRRRYLSTEQLALLTERLERDFSMGLESFVEHMDGRGQWPLMSGLEAKTTGQEDTFFHEGDQDFAPVLDDTVPRYGNTLETGNWIDEMIVRGLAHTQHHHSATAPALVDGTQLAKRNQPHHGNEEEQESNQPLKQLDEGDNSNLPMSNRGKRNLVCDCCYSACTIQTIALYC